MKKSIIAVALFASTAAVAQSPAPKMAPIVLDEAKLQRLMTIVGEMPTKYGENIMLFLRDEATKAEMQSHLPAPTPSPSPIPAPPPPK